MPDLKLTARNGEPRRLSVPNRHESTDAGRRPWGSSVFALLVVVTLFALGVANIAVRAQWHEVEDGVFWGARSEGVTAVDVAPGSAADVAGVRPGDILLAVNGAPVQTAADVIAYQHRGREGTELSYVARSSRNSTSAPGFAGGRQPHDFDVLRAGSRRPVHLAGRRVGSCSTAPGSGDAALLLVVRGVLRRLHVLVQRPVRSIGLDVLLGRRGRDGAVAAAPAALHAGLPGTAALAGVDAAGGAAAGHVSAGGRSWRGSHCGDCQGRHRWRVPLARAGFPGSSRAGVSVPLRRGSDCRSDSGLRRNHLAHRPASAPLDRVGHGPRRRSVCAWLCAPVGVRIEPAARAPVDRDPTRPGAARVCVRDRPLPAPRRGSDHQARHGVYGVPGRKRGALPRHAEGRRASSFTTTRIHIRASWRCWRRLSSCCSRSRSARRCRTRSIGFSTAIDTTIDEPSWGLRAT